jgi:hypothetical protein
MGYSLRHDRAHTAGLHDDATKEKEIASRCSLKLADYRTGSHAAQLR